MSYIPFLDNPDLAGIDDDTQEGLKYYVDLIDESSARGAHDDACKCEDPKCEILTQLLLDHSASTHETLGWLTAKGMFVHSASTTHLLDQVVAATAEVTRLTATLADIRALADGGPVRVGSHYDPHSSRDGIRNIREVLTWGEPYDPAPVELKHPTPNELQVSPSLGVGADEVVQPEDVQSEVDTDPARPMRAWRQGAVQAARPAQGVLVETKTCVTCEKVKPATAFKVPRGAHADGETCLLADCRACRNAQHASKTAPPPPLPTAEQLAAIHRAGWRR